MITVLDGKNGEKVGSGEGDKVVKRVDSDERSLREYLFGDYRKFGELIWMK
jgi:hypothetical protein